MMKEWRVCEYIHPGPLARNFQMGWGPNPPPSCLTLGFNPHKATTPRILNSFKGYWNQSSFKKQFIFDMKSNWDVRCPYFPFGRQAILASSISTTRSAPATEWCVSWRRGSLPGKLEDSTTMTWLGPRWMLEHLGHGLWCTAQPWPYAACWSWGFSDSHQVLL